MKIRLRVPVEREVEPSEALSLAAGGGAQPFSGRLIDFCAALSEALLADAEARRYPELQALGFWLRRSQLLSLKESFSGLAEQGLIAVPRGLVFHVPPSNVDALFVYSWAFSFLAGNASVVRLSPRPSRPTDILCRLLGAQFRRDPFQALSRGALVVSYGHEDEPTAVFSAACDLRVLWGGDEAVARLRAFPLKPRARDLTFPDRWSFCLLDAGRVLALDDAALASLAGDFFNDAFWYDQRACASPRLVVWRGAPPERDRASARFFSRLRETITEKGARFETGAVLGKLAFAYESALAAPVVAQKNFGNELTLLRVRGLEGLPREHCGAGLLFEAGVESLEEAAGFVSEKDQTMTHFGLSAEELRAFAGSLNGRGLDRLVPVGRALAFDRYWDGCDLAREMMRLVRVEGGREEGR